VFEAFARRKGILAPEQVFPRHITSAEAYKSGPSERH
jgi:hypothetical protein